VTRGVGHKAKAASAIRQQQKSLAFSYLRSRKQDLRIRINLFDTFLIHSPPNYAVLLLVSTDLLHLTVYILLGQKFDPLVIDYLVDCTV